MPMRVINNWWKILTKAWTVRFILIGAVFSGLAAATPFMDLLTTDPKILFWLIAIINTGAFIARFIPQKGLSDD